MLLLVQRQCGILLLLCRCCRLRLQHEAGEERQLPAATGSTAAACCWRRACCYCWRTQIKQPDLQVCSEQVKRQQAYGVEHSSSVARQRRSAQ